VFRQLKRELAKHKFRPISVKFFNAFISHRPSDLEMERGRFITRKEGVESVLFELRSPEYNDGVDYLNEGNKIGAIEDSLRAYALKVHDVPSERMKIAMTYDEERKRWLLHCRMFFAPVQ